MAGTYHLRQLSLLGGVSSASGSSLLNMSAVSSRFTGTDAEAEAEAGTVFAFAFAELGRAAEV